MIFTGGYNGERRAFASDIECSLLGAVQESIRCYHSILVGRYLEAVGIKAHDILHKGNLASQGEIEEALLERGFGQRDQLTIAGLFQGELDREAMLQEYYWKANEEIGRWRERLDGNE